MDKADVQAAFMAAGLSRLIKDIDALSQPAIRLYTTSVNESSLSVGASKLGGVPDLPSEVIWPQEKGLPQSFIAQIRLEDIRDYDTTGVLPHTGMLWFFYDARQETFGADPVDRGGWLVLFRDDPGTLQRTSAPATLPASSQFQACSIRFASEITLSQHPELEIPNFDWTEAEQRSYETLLSTFPNPVTSAAIHNQLLGNPDTLQDDMRLECELASHGVTDASDAQLAEFSKSAMEWRLLLQVDSDEHAGMRWGNEGLLYYWIKKANLRACRFDATWLILQSE